MITLNEIAYNIKNLAYGGDATLENNLSLRQIKHWIHYHRAKLIAENIDKGITNDQALYQPMALTLRNSTSSTAVNYYNAWSEYEKGIITAPPAITAGYIENHPRHIGGRLTGLWLANSSLSNDSSGDSQKHMSAAGRSQFGTEIKRSQNRGDFRNFGAASFWTPRPLMLKNNNGIKTVNVERMVHFPDDASTTGADEKVGGAQHSSIIIYNKTKDDAKFGHSNKFTDNTKPYFYQVTARQNREDNAHGNYIIINGLQVSPNYHGNLHAPGKQKLFWKYRATTAMILENPTEIDVMYDWWWEPKVDWDDATTPYPIPMEYVQELVQRVVQTELSISLKTPSDIITDGVDNTKFKQQERGS